MSKIRVGLIGYGLSSRVFHIPLLKDHPRFEITGIVTSKPKDSLGVNPSIKLVASVSELVKLDIDLVIVCTPNHLHFEHAMTALQAGKHVVVEKPFSPTSEECKKLIEVAKEKNLKLTVFQNRRYDADFLTIQKLIQNKTLEDIVYYEAHFDRFKPTVDDRWKEQDLPGGGILYDLGAHLIDQALVLFGRPDSVIADLGTLRPGAKQCDYFHLNLNFKNLKVILHATTIAAAVGPRFTIHTKNASFIKYGMDPQEAQLKESLPLTSPQYGQEVVENYGQLTNGRGEVSSIKSEVGSYVKFYDQLALALDHKGEVPVKPEDSLDVIKVIEQAVLAKPI